MSSNADHFLRETYRFYPEAFKFLYPHSCAVASLSQKIAEKVGADVELVFEASILHDIGVFKTNAPSIGCFGTASYIQHGVLGAEFLRDYPEFSKYASFCETHVGVSISKEEIIDKNLPLPHKSMEPTTLEEQIVAYADIFFSKSSNDLRKTKSFEDILSKQRSLSVRGAEILQEWHSKFSL